MSGAPTSSCCIPSLLPSTFSFSKSSSEPEKKTSLFKVQRRGYSRSKQICNCQKSEATHPVSRRAALSFIPAISLTSFTLPAKADDKLSTNQKTLADQVLKSLEEASDLWGQGLDPANKRRRADLQAACAAFDRLVELEPQRIEWREARGQVRVDAKRFTDALQDFDFVIAQKPNDWRAHSSRALALEGLALWQDAVDEYTTALTLQNRVSKVDIAYVLNSRGNANASLRRWEEALDDYELSRKLFQQTRQLDGAIYAASNAALVQIQLGKEAEGEKALASVARRAPASIDMRAALAALYWSQGRESEAEQEWEFACENINSGQYFDSCAQYKDQDWLRGIRRWPPGMADRMDDFFRLRSRKLDTKDK